MAGDAAHMEKIRAMRGKNRTSTSAAPSNDRETPEYEDAEETISPDIHKKADAMAPKKKGGFQKLATMGKK